MARNHSDSSGGCGCLILLVICGVSGFVVNQCKDLDTKELAAPQKQQAEDVYRESPRNRFSSSEAEEELSEEDKAYLDNSLPTGAAPYARFYGKNYECPYSQCSGIEVTAPHNSDIVVVIKKNNKDGKVVQHGYIRAGDTYQFDVPNGVYQTFFFYGKGWNPEKEMAKGIRGGFVKDMVFSKDNPQEIYSGVLSYVLQLQRSGNFQTKGSNPAEMF